MQVSYDDLGILFRLLYEQCRVISRLQREQNELTRTLETLQAKTDGAAISEHQELLEKGGQQ